MPVGGSNKTFDGRDADILRPAGRTLAAVLLDEGAVLREGADILKQMDPDGKLPEIAQDVAEDIAAVEKRLKRWHGVIPTVPRAGVASLPQSWQETVEDETGRTRSVDLTEETVAAVAGTQDHPRAARIRIILDDTRKDIAALALRLTAGEAGPPVIAALTAAAESLAEAAELLIETEHPVLVD